MVEMEASDVGGDTTLNTELLLPVEVVEVVKILVINTVRMWFRGYYPNNYRTGSQTRELEVVLELVVLVLVVLLIVLTVVELVEDTTEVELLLTLVLM